MIVIGISDQWQEKLVLMLMQKMMYVAAHSELLIQKGGPSQVLKHSITKLVLIVENEFDSIRWSHKKIDKMRIILWGARCSGVIWT